MKTIFYISFPVSFKSALLVIRVQVMFPPNLKSLWLSDFVVISRISKAWDRQTDRRIGCGLLYDTIR